MESAVSHCQNRLLGAKRCPGPGTKFNGLVTSRVVFMSGRAVDFLMFSSYLFFIFSGLLALFLIILAQY